MRSPVEESGAEFVASTIAMVCTFEKVGSGGLLVDVGVISCVSVECRGVELSDLWAAVAVCCAGVDAVPPSDLAFLSYSGVGDASMECPGESVSFTVSVTFEGEGALVKGVHDEPDSEFIAFVDHDVTREVSCVGDVVVACGSSHNNSVLVVKCS